MRSLAAAIICLASITATLLLGSCSDSGTSPDGPDTVRVTFRDGALPLPSWYGTRDAVIRNGPTVAMRTSNYGTAPADTLGTARAGAGLYVRRLLVRFDLTSITDCGALLEASLTLRIVPEDTSVTVQLDAWEATVPASFPSSWVEGFQGDGVSWLYVDEGVTEWNAEGGDMLGLMDSKTVKADTSVTFELETARVERWIKYPQTNDGVVITPPPGVLESFVFVYMREAADISLRPELKIIYLKGG